MLKPFDPKIDRYVRSSAARLFELLWPAKNVSQCIAEHLADSIRAAHAVATGSWEITMFADCIRLNVGQVETLTLLRDEMRFFFHAPLKLPAEVEFDVQLPETPVFDAVPVPSGICYVPHDKICEVPNELRLAHEHYIREAAVRKSVSPFKKSFSPAVLEHVEELLGETLPRPSYIPATTEPKLLPEEIDPAETFREGARIQIFVNAYERDLRARSACIAAHGDNCVVCGFSFGATYGADFEGLIHVHHLKPLSEIGSEYEVDPVKDLRPVCPNCHAALHATRPALTIDALVQLLNRSDDCDP